MASPPVYFFGKRPIILPAASSRKRERLTRAGRDPVTVWDKVEAVGSG
jgi:hypothetical protein